MADASSVRKCTTLPVASRNKSSIRFQSTTNKLLSCDGTNWVETSQKPQIQLIPVIQATPATSTVFIASQPCRVTAVSYIAGTATASTGTVQVTKDTGVNAPGEGNYLLTNNTSTGFACNTTADTVVAGTLTATTGNLLLVPGDRLSVKYIGTITSLANVAVTIEIETIAPTQTIVSVPTIASAFVETMFVAPVPCQIKSVRAVWSTAETTAGAVTVTVTKETTTAAPGAGTSTLAALLSVKTTANTVATPALATTASTLQLLTGDRLTVKMAGNKTALAGLVVAVEIQGLPNEMIYINRTNKAVADQINQPLLIATRMLQVKYVSGVWATVSGTSGTIAIEKTTGTTAAGSGTTVMATPATFDLTATINTVVPDVLATTTVITLQTGDRLSTKIGGTMGTGCVNVAMTVGLNVIA